MQNFLMTLSIMSNRQALNIFNMFTIDSHLFRLQSLNFFPYRQRHGRLNAARRPEPHRARVGVIVAYGR